MTYFFIVTLLIIYYNMLHVVSCMHIILRHHVCTLLTLYEGTSFTQRLNDMKSQTHMLLTAISVILVIV